MLNRRSGSKGDTFAAGCSSIYWHFKHVRGLLGFCLRGIPATLRILVYKTDSYSYGFHPQTACLYRVLQNLQLDLFWFGHKAWQDAFPDSFWSFSICLMVNVRHSLLLFHEVLFDLINLLYDCIFNVHRKEVFFKLAMSDNNCIIISGSNWTEFCRFRWFKIFSGPQGCLPPI